jgi:hypothetical protein
MLGINWTVTIMMLIFLSLPLAINEYKQWVGTTGTKHVQFYKYIRFILHAETQLLLGGDQGEETKNTKILYSHGLCLISLLIPWILSKMNISKYANWMIKKNGNLLRPMQKSTYCLGVYSWKHSIKSCLYKSRFKINAFITTTSIFR